MKEECDKLATQLSVKEDAHALIHKKYQLLKQELDDSVRLLYGVSEKDTVHSGVRGHVSPHSPLTCNN